MYTDYKLLIYIRKQKWRYIDVQEKNNIEEIV